MATARSGADPVVRAPSRDELAGLREIEVAAGRSFAAIGMDWVAAHEPPPIEELEAYRAAGLAWVVVADRMPVGYVIAEVLDHALAGPDRAALHVEQVSVHPAAAHRRLGRRLIERVADEARARGLGAMTLTTFRDVPWNAAYYERCGFAVVSEDGMGAGLRRVRADEVALGLDREPRVAMHRTP